MFEAIKKALALAELVAGLIPVIKKLILEMEVPGNGALKAEAVIEIVKAIWEILPEEARQLLGVEKLATFVKFVIDPIVKLFKAAGLLLPSGAPKG